MSQETISLSEHFPASHHKDWIEAALAALKGKPLASITPQAWESIERFALYTAEEPDPPVLNRVLPAQDQRPEKSWDIRALLQGQTKAELSQAAHIARTQGAHSLWFQQSSMTCNNEDLLAALAEIALAQVPLFVDIQDIATGKETFLAAMASQDIPNAKWRGGAQVDLASSFATRGQLSKTLDASWDEVAAFVQWAHQEAPQLQTLCVSGLAFHNAGADAALEIAIVLAHLVATMKALEARGSTLEDIAQHSSIRVGIGRDMWTEIAKCRALRITLRKVFDGCGLAGTLPIHACNSSSTMTQRDPWVNLLRSTAACFSAAIGGADALTLLPFDHAVGAQSTLGQRQAINIQHILAQESHLHRVIDPAGGSWCIEHMTDQVARLAWQHFQSIERQGGLFDYLQDGGLQRDIAASVAHKQRAIAKRKVPILGVSEYANLAEAIPKQPSAATSSATASAVATEAASDAPGHTPTCEALVPFRWSADWEALRDASDRYKATHGQLPQVFLLNIGPIPAHKARASFATRFFAAGGFECIENDGFQDVASAAAACAASGAIGAVICGTDSDYQEWVTPLAQSLSDTAFLVLAGRMGEREQAWTQAGVTHAVYLGCDALSLLQQLQQLAGVLP